MTIDNGHAQAAIGSATAKEVGGRDKDGLGDGDKREENHGSQDPPC